MKNIVLLPVYDKSSILKIAIERILGYIDEDSQILVIDDGSEDDTAETIETSEQVKYLRHEKGLGYGAALLSGFRYAHDMEFENIIILDIQQKNCEKALDSLLAYLNQGYDMVSCSRIAMVEHDSEYSVLNVSNSVTYKLNNATGYKLTDPFSPFKALKLSTVNKLELEEFDEAIFIQAWIQSAFYGLKVKEFNIEPISMDSINEDDFLENEIDHYLKFIDSEKFLYPIQKIN